MKSHVVSDAAMFSYRGTVPDSSAEEDSIHEQAVQSLKNKLQTMLKSYEMVIFYFQQLFVWEKPMHSLVFVLMLHAGFWYVVNNPNATKRYIQRKLLNMIVDIVIKIIQCPKTPFDINLRCSMLSAT